MAIQYENITVTITGANPQTKVVSVPVDTSSGTGSATFTYTGTNGGADTLQASGTMAGSSYTSPSALVNWQVSNGQLQIGPVTAYMWNDSPHSGPVGTYTKFNINDPAAHIGNGYAYLTTSSGYVGSATGNSLMFDIGGAGDPTDTSWQQLGPTGGYLGVTDPFPGTRQNWNMCLLTNLLVPTAGVHTLNVMNKNCITLGVGGVFGGTPFLTGVSAIYSGQTLSAYTGYPLAGSASNNNVGYPQPITPISVNFPSAGIYPIEVDWDFWYHSGRSLQVTGDSGALLTPVASIIGVPAASNPTGNLIITPAGGLTNFGFTGNSITLTIQVSGITFTSKSYCPVLEGTSGNLALYNDPTNNVFNLQTYNGQGVNKSAAASQIFSLSTGDNSAYIGLFGPVSFDGTNFNLPYNGGTANPNLQSRVLSTNLIVTADDIAWFNSANNSFDLFGVSGSSGGISFNFEVDYMNKPSVSSISPTTITANGGSYTLSIALNKAFSPQQQGAKNTGNSINCTCTISGAASTGTPVSVLDSSGWLTGWSVPFVAQASTTNQTYSVNLSVSGQLTYLSGGSFVTNTVSYINTTVGSITANGSSYVAPTAISMAVAPTDYTYSSGSINITPSLFTAGGNDSVTCTIFMQPVGSSTKTTIGTASILSSMAGTWGGVSGFLQAFSFPDYSVYNLPVYPSTAYLGFIATDNVSGLTCTYTSTTRYYYQPSGAGGGGGGGY